MLRVRVWAYAQLTPTARRSKGLSLTNATLSVLIILGVMLSIFETEPTLFPVLGGAFNIFELALGTVFLVEYVVRIWIAPEGAIERPASLARWRFILSVPGLLDLAAAVASLIPTIGPGGLLLRIVRLLRILRLAKLGRFSRAFDHIAQAVHSRRDELLVSLIAGLCLILASATLLYFAEGAAQPEKFGSIIRALWWAVATFTTIGYGDVYPITPLGKVCASLTAIVSIGFVAMPTGILAASFSDAMARHRESIAGEKPSV